MKEFEDTRKWYEKKRYLIPIILFILFTFLGGDSEQYDVNNISLPQESKSTERKQVFESTSPKIEEVLKPAKKISSPPKQSCHPSYSGCLNPNASDYDCAGGSGNGPYYTGTVRVVGPDVFGLDRDNDGWGCE